MWNYRVTKVNGKYSIQEVYYNDDGTIEGYCDASIDNWNTIEELKGTLEYMLLAFNAPVIKYRD